MTKGRLSIERIQPLVGLGGAKDEASHSTLREDAKEKEALEPSVTTFVFCTGEIFGREQGKIDGALSEDTRDEEGQALEAGEIEIEK